MTHNVTVTAESDESYISSSDAVYATARDGGGALSINHIDNDLYVGQRFIGIYVLFEGFIEFDTSFIEPGDIILSASLRIFGSADNSVDDFTLQARAYPAYTPPLSTAEWRTGAELNALTLLATFASSGWNASGWNSFTESGSELVDNIIANDSTKIAICSDKTVGSGTAPTTDESVIADGGEGTNPPELILTYEGGSVVGFNGTFA